MQTHVTGGINHVGAHDSNTKWYAKYWRDRMPAFEKAFADARRK